MAAHKSSVFTKAPPLPVAPPATWPKLGHVSRHPDDKNRYPKAVETCDPAVWRADPSEWDNGRVRKWGIHPYVPDLDQDSDTLPPVGGFSAEGFSEVLRMIKTLEHTDRVTLLYHPIDTPVGIQNPTQQFIQALERRKLGELKKDPEVKAALDTSLVIRISLTSGAEAVWRRFQVPAAISLAVLHDQVLIPVMGWARAYHGYVFEDPNDGSVFGPKRYAGYIDIMHADMRYTYIADDRKLPLASLIRKVGDHCFYTYDLGDSWEHRLEVEQVLNSVPEAQDDRIRLLDGECACPPEDSNGLATKGLHGYSQFLREYRKKPNSKKSVLREVEATAVNYKVNPVGMSLKFRPLEFNKEYHSALLAVILAGPGVQKKNMYYCKETVRQCNVCQERLRPLKQCSRCKKTLYCSTECQKSDWKDHKKVCKPLKKDGDDDE